MKDTYHDSKSFETNPARTIINKYIKYWPLFVGSLLIGLVIVYLNLRYFAVNQYEVAGKILINNTSTGNSSGQMNQLSDLGLIKTVHSIDDEIGILTSTGIMEEVITTNSLNISYFIAGDIRDVEIYGANLPVKILVDETSDSLAYDLPIHIRFVNAESYELSAEHKEKELKSIHNFGELVMLPYGTFTIVPEIDATINEETQSFYFVVSNKDALVTQYLRNLSVVPANKTGSLLNLNFITNNKKKGEAILSKLIETYIANTIKYENELAENTIKMIDDRLKLLSGEIESVEKSVADFKTQNVVTDVSSNADIFIQQANDYKKRAADYQTQISVLTDIEQTLMRGSIESTIGGGFTLNDASLTSMINKFNDTFLERQQLSQSAVTSNPIIVNLDANLASLREAILQNVRSTKNSLTIAKGNLQANANRYDAQIAKVPAMERALLDISRDQGTKEGLYLYLLQKREEEVLSLATPVSSTRIVSLPKAGEFPISPNKKLMYLTGILLGLFIPISILYTKEAINNKVTSPEDITNAISVPFLGEITKSTLKEKLVNDIVANSPSAELFRLLSFNLDYLKKTEKNQTLLVTSTVKGEGKTFIAANLAITFAANGEKVALLAFDLREPQLMKNFDLPNSPGIIDFIVKKGYPIDLIMQQHPTIENLYLIGSGTTNAQVGPLLLSNRIETLMDSLKQDFDRIIIDTPPIGLISDAFALNRYTDGTIYIVRNNVSKKEYLKNIASIHKNEKLKNTMVLLNDIKAAGVYGYGSKEV